MRVRSLPPGLDDAAAWVLSEAFWDEPNWKALAPRDKWRRWATLHRYHRAAIRITRRWGGITHAAFDDERLLGTLLGDDEGRRPPPWSLAHMGPTALTAGPRVVLRALPALLASRGHRLTQPHLYVWILGVHPAWQRRGVGHALLDEVIADAERRALPVALATGQPENVAYYERFGFQVTGEEQTAHARLWFMRRPAPGA